MDQFRQAVDLARNSASLASGERRSIKGDDSSKDAASHILRREQATSRTRLDTSHLKAMRIVAHDKEDARARTYDMLRTQVLQSLDNSGSQILAVTSPTASCGKTVTACNLALSIARLPERSVLLIDLDMRKPKVARYLGYQKSLSLLDVLQGRANLADALANIETSNSNLSVLACEESGASSEWMASQAMTVFFDAIKREFRSRTIIVDLPPVLAGDDVLSIMQHVQSMLLVVGAGSSTKSEVQECCKHLKNTPVVRVVVNKILEPEVTAPYHEYY